MHNRNVCNNYLTLIIQKYVVKIQDGSPILLLIIQLSLSRCRMDDNKLSNCINHEVIKKIFLSSEF